MMKYAITGGIGSGKTYICNILKIKGFDIYNCDEAAKKLMCISTEVKDAIIKLIGTNAYKSNEPDKTVIAAFILKSKKNMTALNSIIHPQVAADFIASKQNFLESAILFESGFDKLVDKVICVTAPLEMRINRIMQRDTISRVTAQKWIYRQMKQEEKAKRSDYIIVNDEKSNLNSQIDNIILKIKNT